jgi:hypothetical protein
MDYYTDFDDWMDDAEKRGFKITGNAEDGWVAYGRDDGILRGAFHEDAGSLRKS